MVEGGNPSTPEEAAFENIVIKMAVQAMDEISLVRTDKSGGNEVFA